jgi:cytidyltransferase-like protein
MNRIVFTNGTFDLFHLGHFNLLTFCRDLAQEDGQVIVGLDSDDKIKKDKGPNRPIFEYWERERNLLSLKIGDKFIIDKIIGFNTNEILHEIIKKNNVNIIVKGMQYSDKVVIGSDLCQIIYCPMVDDMSSTRIIERVTRKVFWANVTNGDRFER